MAVAYRFSVFGETLLFYFYAVCILWFVFSPSLPSVGPLSNHWRCSRPRRNTYRVHLRVVRWPAAGFDYAAERYPHTVLSTGAHTVARPWRSKQNGFPCEWNVSKANAERAWSRMRELPRSNECCVDQWRVWEVCRPIGGKKEGKLINKLRPKCRAFYLKSFERYLFKMYHGQLKYKLWNFNLLLPVSFVKNLKSKTNILLVSFLSCLQFRYEQILLEGE